MLLRRFTKRYSKVLFVSKLGLVILLIAIGSFNFLVEFKDREQARNILCSPEPDYLAEIMINNIIYRENEMENLSTIEEISRVFFYRTIIVEEINNNTNFGTYSVSSIRIFGISKSFFEVNNIEESIFIEEGIIERLRENITNEFIVKGIDSETYCSFNNNLTTYTILSRTNISALMDLFIPLKLKEQYQYIIMPLQTLISATDFKHSNEINQRIYLYLQEKHVFSINELKEYASSTFDKVVSRLMEHNLSSFKLSNLINSRIKVIEKSRIEEIKQKLILCTILIFASVPLMYYSFILKKERFKQIISLLKAKGGTKHFFLQLLSKTELLIAIIISGCFILIYMIIEYSFFKKINSLIYLLFYNLVLIEVLTSFYINTKIFKKGKLKIELKTSVHHKITVKGLKLILIALLLAAIIALIYYIGKLFYINKTKLLIFLILGFVGITIVTQTLKLTISSIINVISKATGRIFGEIALFMKKGVLQANRSSAKIMIILSFFTLFVIANSIVGSVETLQEQLIENKVGGDITISNLQPNQFNLIQQMDEINSSTAIFCAHVLPPLQQQVDEKGVPLYFVEKQKVIDFLHFKGLTEQYIAEIKEKLNKFSTKNDSAIVSKQLADKLIDNSELLIFPDNELANNEIYLSEMPYKLTYNVLTTVQYLPYFSNISTDWIIVPIEGKYPINKTYTNTAMLNIKSNVDLERFCQQLRTKFPSIRISTLETEKLKIDNEDIYQTIKIQSLLILLVGTILLLEQSPLEYRKAVHILFSRGLEKRRIQQILVVYQVTLEIVLLFIVFLSGEVFARIAILFIRSQSYYQYESTLITAENLVFFIIVCIAQVIKYFQIKSKTNG